MTDTKTIIEAVGWISSAMAIAGCVLNNYKMRWCFVPWLFSNALSAWIHISSGPGLYSLAWRDVVFFALAVHGLWAWRQALPASMPRGSQKCHRNQSGPRTDISEFKCDCALGTPWGTGKIENEELRIEKLENEKSKNTVSVKG